MTKIFISRIIARLFTSFTLGVFVCLWAATSYASNGDIFDRFVKPIPEVPEIAEEDFEEATKLVKKRPYGDGALAYSVRVPKDWVEREGGGSSNFILNEKLFLDLNTFYSPGSAGGRSRIEIQALNMPDFITGSQWYLQYILESGFATEGLVIHGPNDVESLMVVMEQDTSFYQRSRVFLNGDKIMMVRYLVPVARIQDEAAMQAKVLQSFALMEKKSRTLPEMDMYRFLDIAEFHYPKGWQVFATPIKTVDRLDATVINIKEVKKKKKMRLGNTTATEAKLDVTLVAATQKTTLVEEVENYRKKIELNGVLVGDKLDIDHEFVYDDTIDFGLTEVYQGVNSGNNLSEHEFWFTVIVAGNYYNFLMLLTPSRNERFGVWARNTEYYKEIVRRYKPMAGAFLERD